MNKRIQALAEQCYHRYSEHHIDLEKFAELIVQECIGLCDQAVEENKRTFYTVNETQEVGPALVAKGCQVQAEKLSKQIKQHFGVEE
jgi:hypothetical protein